MPFTSVSFKGFFFPHCRNLVTSHRCALYILSIWLTEGSSLPSVSIAFLEPIGKRDEQEPLTNTVQSDSAVIGGIIAVVTFVTFCVIGIMICFLYQHKQSHRTNQTKEKEYPETLSNSFRNVIDLQNTASECKREYFI
eukprot:XP_008765139.1 PREDICTED: contactin-associated protein like 5-1-like [Rattus norvegicus]